MNGFRALVITLVSTSFFLSGPGFAATSPSLEPDVCDYSGEGYAVARFVNYANKLPLFLKVTGHPNGDFEAAYGDIENVDGKMWGSIQMDVAGTENNEFGPYLFLFLNVPGEGTKELTTPLNTGQNIGTGDLPNSIRRSFRPAMYGYPSGTTIDSGYIEAGQVGGNGSTYIDNVQLDNSALTKITKVLDCGN
ncbi:MAG TPA: hypothetical protein V6C81_17945 [Planktothrix sp.]|jgi:hypothetical protein